MNKSVVKERAASLQAEKKEELNIFDVLAALDKKDYGYYDRLSPEQQKKFIPYLVTIWMSAVKGSSELQSYYLQNTNMHANLHLFNDSVQKHPSLQWMMLCAASPGVGKQFHQWIPNIRLAVTTLREPAKMKEIHEYFKKIYPTATPSDVELLSKTYVDIHKKKMYLSAKYPNLKYDEIEMLSELITEEEIENDKKGNGN